MSAGQTVASAATIVDALQHDATTAPIVRLTDSSGTMYADAAGDAGQPTSFTNLPQVNSQTQSLLLPKGEQARLRVHQYDWGVFNRDGGTAAGFGPVGRYGTNRSAEDWQILGDPHARAIDADPFDLLKYIPLTPGGSVYLSFSGEERFRNYYENRPEIGRIKTTDSGRVTLRSIYGADLHVGPHLRFYGEVVNGDAGGTNPYNYSQGYTTRLDLLQAFAEVNGKVLGAKSGVMAGRMQFYDAPEYVFYQRSISNVPESWNGVRGYAVWPRVRFDLFDFVQTNVNPPALFHDIPSWNTRLFGAYESYAIPDFKFLGQDGHIFADTFYYGYIFNGTPAAVAESTRTVSGSTRRDNYGVRLWGKAGPVEFSLGGIYQGGRFYQANSHNTRPVSAYAFNNSVVWRFAHAWGSPAVGVQADLYSGGDNTRNTGSVGTYVLPYVPSSNYLDTTAYIGTSNVIAIAPKADITLTRFAVLRMKVPFFWRDTTRDSIYGLTYVYQFPKYSGGFIGATPQATLALRLYRHLTWTNDLGRFFASRSLSRAGATDGTYYLSTFTFDF